jgi:hypothetical protein
MDNLAAQRMSPDYYRRQAAQARRLAGDATTPMVKERLRDLAARFERLAGVGRRIKLDPWLGPLPDVG